VARAVLLLGAGCWSVAALVALAVALVGAERLLAALPPLAIDADAIRGAAVAVAIGLGASAAVHVAVLVFLRAGRRIAWSAAVLVCGLVGATFVGLAASAFTSAAAEPAGALPLIGAGVAASIVAAGYLAAAVGFVAEIRAGRPHRRTP
jgi:hypothetical protein